MIRERMADPRFPRFVQSIEVFTNETDVQINVLRGGSSRGAIVL